MTARCPVRRLVLLALIAAGGASRADAIPVVRTVYLVPSDRTPDARYTPGLAAAVRHARVWYRNEMGDGTTFAVHDPVVETVSLPNPVSWYNGDPTTPFGFWFRVLDDAFHATGATFDDPNHRWLFYIDADPACGQQIGGAAGVALIQANGLRCLAHLERIDECTGDVTDAEPVCRCIGGLGHELGHALGLPHPPGCDEDQAMPPCQEALMYLGYLRYPEAILLPEDRSTLANGGFFFPAALPADLPPCGCGDAVRNDAEQCDGASDNACRGACRADCTCAPPCQDVDDAGAKVVVKTRKEAGVLKAKVLLPLVDYAGEPVAVRLFDADGSIAEAIVGPLPPAGPKGTRWVYRADGGGVKKIALRAHKDGSGFTLLAKSKRWFTSAAADLGAEATHLEIMVGGRCFRHGATEKLD